MSVCCGKIGTIMKKVKQEEKEEVGKKQQEEEKEKRVEEEGRTRKKRTERIRVRGEQGRAPGDGRSLSCTF